MGHLYLYIHDLRASGVVRNALAYAAHLAPRHRTTVVAGYAEGLWRGEIGRQPFEIVALDERPGAMSRLSAIPRLRRWLKSQPPGLLFSFGNFGHPTAFGASRGLAHIHRAYRISNGVSRTHDNGNRIRTLWMRLLAKSADRMILVGGAVAGEPVFANALARNRATSIPNGVDLARARDLARAPSPHPWLEADVPVAVAIGRLRPQKNFDLLIEALALARRERPMRLILIGGGTAEETARLGGLAKAAGIGDAVLLAGETDNVFAWLARADVFALPSRWEGSSMALLEALAVGTPVVVSRLAGDAAMVLDEGRYGILFDGIDPAALTEGLLRQISPARIMPGQRAEAYSFASIAARYAEVVEDVLGKLRA